MSVVRAAVNEAAHTQCPSLRTQATLPTDPTYRVILHNGEPSGSAAGHFDGTRLGFGAGFWE